VVVAAGRGGTSTAGRPRLTVPERGRGGGKGGFESLLGPTFRGNELKTPADDIGWVESLTDSTGLGLTRELSGGKGGKGTWGHPSSK